MKKNQIEQLLNLLESISLSEWKKIKDCVDREFASQTNAYRFQKRDTFKKILEIDLTQ